MTTGGRGRTAEGWLTTAGTYAGALAALGGFVYLVGGLVMWLRFRTADLPADQGVALMSREQLFVVGLRLMVIPLLITGTIAAVLADRAANEGERGRGPVRRVALAAALVVTALLVVWSFAVAGWPTGLAVLLDALVLAGGVCMVATARRAMDGDAGGGHGGGPARWPAPATAGAVAVLIVVLCVAVPALHVDEDAGVRLLVAGAALLLMTIPAAVVVAVRLRRPPPRLAWIGVASVAVLAGMVVASSWWIRLAVVLGAIVVAGTLATTSIVLRETVLRGVHPRLWWLLPTLAIAAVGLIVPWSFASATWPLGLGLVVAVWLWRRRRLRNSSEPARIERERRRLPAYMAAAAVLAAAVVSIGRQLDEPVQLLHATVTFKDGGPPAEGAYVNAGSDMVYIGDQRDGTIEAIPRAEVRQVAVGPPDARAPSPSLLSRLLPGERRFSVRPLEVWCDGEKYGWFEAGKLCRTQPRLLWKTELHYRDMDRLGMPTRVRCPREARDVCRGWVLLRSRSNYLHGPAGVPRPVVPDPVHFAVGQGKVTEVCTTLTAGQLRLLRRTHGESPVPFEAVVAHDPEGETVLDRGDYGLLVGRTRLGNVGLRASDCEPRLVLEPAVRAGAVTVSVIARPRARGITPWRVAGAVRLTAERMHRSVPDAAEREAGPPLELGERRLIRGRADFSVHLSPGTWVVTARYRSVAGIAYPEPSPEVVVTVPPRSRIEKNARAGTAGVASARDGAQS